MIFLDMTPTMTGNKRKKIDKLDFIKTKNFCASKVTIKKLKTQSKWENIFANRMSDKGLIFRIYKKLQLNNKKTSNRIKK